MKVSENYLTIPVTYKKWDIRDKSGTLNLSLSEKMGQTGHTPKGVSECPILSQDGISGMSQLEVNMKLNRTFEEKLNSCLNLGELEGFANRRQIDPSLPKWTEDERRMILAKKYEMEKRK